MNDITYYRCNYEQTSWFQSIKYNSREIACCEGVQPRLYNIPPELLTNIFERIIDDAPQGDLVLTCKDFFRLLISKHLDFLTGLNLKIAISNSDWPSAFMYCKQFLELGIDRRDELFTSWMTPLVSEQVVERSYIWEEDSVEVLFQEMEGIHKAALELTSTNPFNLQIPLNVVNTFFNIASEGNREKKGKFFFQLIEQCFSNQYIDNHLISQTQIIQHLLEVFKSEDQSVALAKGCKLLRKFPVSCMASNALIVDALISSLKPNNTFPAEIKLFYVAYKQLRLFMSCKMNPITEECARRVYDFAKEQIGLLNAVSLEKEGLLSILMTPASLQFIDADQIEFWLDLSRECFNFSSLFEGAQAVCEKILQLDKATEFQKRRLFLYLGYVLGRRKELKVMDILLVDYKNKNVLF